MYIVGLRPKRHTAYAVHSRHADYGAARITQLDLTKRSGVYDAQVFLAEPLDRYTLVYTHPKALVHLVNPYFRLERLFSDLVGNGSYRCMVSRPSPSQKVDWHRMYLFSYTRIYQRMDSTVHAVDLLPDMNVIRTYRIQYRWGSTPPYTFESVPKVVTPIRSARMQGVYVADVADEYSLYFGYVEAPPDDEQTVLDFARTEIATLYTR